MKTKLSKGLMTALVVLGLLLPGLPILAEDQVGMVQPEAGLSSELLADARQTLEQQLRSVPGFVGIAHSEEQGEIVIFLEDEEARGIASNRFEGFPVRTEVTGVFQARAAPIAEPAAPEQADQIGPTRTGIVRPLMGGTSVSAYVAGQSWMGTLGMVTYDDRILSNAHVIAMDMANSFLPVGTPVVQPGSGDGGVPANRVGELEDYILIDFSPGAVNYADAAIASIDPEIEALIGWQFAAGTDYQVSGTTTIAVGDVVRKSGRTTGVTENETYHTNASVTVDYGGGNTAYFVDQILVYQQFSQPGDSGSVVDKDGEFVGLVFAGSDAYSTVCKASYIIDGLGIAVEPTDEDQPQITVSPADFEVTLPADTVQNCTLTIGNVGDADLTYDISVQEMTVGTGGAADQRLLSMEPTSRILEAPLTGTPVEPEPAGQTHGGWQTIMTDGFEGPWPGVWTTWAATDATDAYWGKYGYRSYTGSYSAFCAKSGTAGVNPPADYPNNMYAWMTYGPFSLGDASAAELNYWLWLDTEYGHDFLWVAASIDGQSFAGSGWTGYSGGWMYDSFDLTDVHTLGNLCGQPQVWIAFVFQSDFSITAEGAFVDDVVLRKYVDDVNSPPNTPSNPFPANHATHVSIDVDLSWTGGDPDADDTVTYDVYFGTSETPPFRETIGPYPATETSITYDDLETLDYGTTYYWKIVATDDHEASASRPVWEFTTAGPPCPWLDVTPDSGLVSPNGSDALTVTIDISSLAPGEYSAEIVITSNDPDKNPTIVPVTLHVSGMPTVTTEAATDIGTDSATLNMSYTLGDHDSVEVRFAYKKAADATWTETSWVAKSAPGTHAEPATGLDTDTLYQFKAQLKYDTTEIEGAERQFTTGQQAEITGVSREVNCDILPGVTGTLYLDDDEIASIVSDEAGNYEIAVPGPGEYTVIASKEGFRNWQQSIPIDGLTTYTVDFVGDHGLVPNAPNMSYVLACINRWQFGEPPCKLAMSRALAVINAWQFPV